MCIRDRCISVSVVVGFLYILNLCLCSSFVMEMSKKFMVLLCSFSAVKVIFLCILYETCVSNVRLIMSIT